MSKTKTIMISCFSIVLMACGQIEHAEDDSIIYAQQEESNAELKHQLPIGTKTGSAIAKSAASIIDPNVRYVPDYRVLDYPGGDVPKGTGVCTDVVIRTLRKVNIDLQKLVHEDMQHHFDKYPKIWGLPIPDKNIDHRRVPNLMTYFDRKNYGLPISSNGKDYYPGDIVTWVLSGGLTHIGIVSNMPNEKGTCYQVIHNIGSGQIAEDVLFQYTITGHYRLP